MDNSVRRYSKLAMQMRAADKDISTFGYNGWVMATWANTSCWLAILKLAIDRPRKKSVALRTDANFTVFVLAEGPDKSLLVDDLLRNKIYIIRIVFCSLPGRSIIVFSLMHRSERVYVHLLLGVSHRLPVIRRVSHGNLVLILNSVVRVLPQPCIELLRIVAWRCERFSMSVRWSWNWLIP